MAVTDRVGTAPLTPFADLQARLIGYASRVEELRTPSDVLDELHAITTRNLPLCVLGAARFPLKSADWGSVQLGKSALPAQGGPGGVVERL